jgi:hypothetical protein
MTTPMPNTPEGGQYPPERATYRERATEQMGYPQGRQPYPPGQGNYPPQRPGQGNYPPQRPRPKVDARALWSGGVATAVVAGLIALVGVLIFRWLFNIPILAPRHDGAYGNAHTTTLVLLSALAALVATALAHLLLLSTPRPMSFLAWIIGLVTVVFVIFPFRTGATIQEKGATAAVYLVIGLAIGSLISGVGERARRRAVVVTQTPATTEYTDLR